MEYKTCGKNKKKYRILQTLNNNIVRPVPFNLFRVQQASGIIKFPQNPSVH